MVCLRCKPVNADSTRNRILTMALYFNTNKVKFYLDYLYFFNSYSESKEGMGGVKSCCIRLYQSPLLLYSVGLDMLLELCTLQMTVLQ